MQPTDTLLLAALRAAPRRYRVPPLPADAAAAAAAGAETALAFAIEAARSARQHGSSPGADIRELFCTSLAQLIADALARDPAFQAAVLRAQDAGVQEHVRLAAHAAADRRALRAAVDAIAHPGKTLRTPAGPMRDALARLHRLLAARAWDELGVAIGELLDQPWAAEHDDVRASLAAVLSSPALERLERAGGLLERDAVQRYEAVRARRGPAAGSDSATAQGRASARVGEGAEQATAAAFDEIVGLLNGVRATAARYRAVHGLLTPAGFPGPAGKAKQEWDAAIVRADAAHDAFDIVLLAEVKSSPVAAASDFSRLHRGLQRLAHAGADTSYGFASAQGPVRITGRSLRALAPHGRVLPPQVIYCCPAPAEPRPPVLGAASKAVLLAEPASLAFAGQIARGGVPQPAALAPVWDALASEPRLRSALHQWETAAAVREAMLHPGDLLDAVTRCLRQGVTP